MANATKYVDNVSGFNGNTGDSPAQAYADIPYAVGVITGGGNTIYVKNNGPGTDYPGGNVLTAGLKGDTTDGRNRLEGYTTTPGARDGRATITSGTTSQALFTLNDNDYWEFVHLRLTHTGATRGTAFGVAGASGTSPWWGTDLVCDGCLQFALTTGLNGVMYLEGVEVKSCTGTYAVGVGTAGYLWGCFIHDNAGDGVRGTAGTTGTFTLVNCIVASNAGIGVSDTSTNANVALTVRGCTIWQNGGSGVKSLAKAANATTWDLCNNVIGANAGYAIESLEPQAEADALARQNRSNSYYTTGTGTLLGLSPGYGDVALTGDPFTSAAGGDFSLNTVAGAGAAVRAAGFPRAFPGSTTTSYLDGGAAQHQDAGGAADVAYW